MSDRVGVLAEITTLATELGVSIDDVEIAHSVEGDRGVLVLVVDALGADPGRGGHRSRLPRRDHPSRDRWVISETLTLGGGAPVVGSVSVPGDKSVSHRALLLAALAEGTSTITGLSSGDDVERTAGAITRLGALLRREGDVVEVEGGRSRLAGPDAPIDLGNSGTGMRLLAGVAASLPGTTVLTGDDSLRRRPMDRIAVPLAAMGADVEGAGDRCLPPLSITGGNLRGIEYTPPMASAQVKGAVLLAGLVAEGETVVREPVATRAYTEEMLAAAGAEIAIERIGRGRTVRLRASRLRPGRFLVPGDPSQAAFWLVAAVIVPDSRVTVEQIDLSEERVGYLGVLERMGAALEVDLHGDHLGSVTAVTRAAGRDRGRRRRDPLARRGTDPRGRRRGRRG